MLTIHTDTLTARQLHRLGPLLPRHDVDIHDHTIAVNPAECPHREALIAWLNATAPIYWYDGPVVPVELRHITKGHPRCSCLSTRANPSAITKPPFRRPATERSTTPLSPAAPSTP